ncbi:hypothetical protein MKW92_045165 [Papaver armeniacum]|nr:hypothetical protein MKW92_045165 [Papaver armeniacum]
MMELNSGSYYIPKSNSKNPQGEDAHFISDNTIGVADGVGGYRFRGIFSPTYVHFNADPMRVLRDTFINTNAQGSSTACILTLTNDKVGRSVYHSPTQLHGFNYPYQLGCGIYSDTPSSADVLEFKEVMSGDVIVMGTDGLFDNLFTSEIEKIILDAEEEAISRGGKIDPKKKSLDPNNPTPFAEAQKEYYILSKGTGGKVDDITVIVSYVS